MKNLLKIAICFLCCHSGFIFAQSGKITGRVQTADQKSMEPAMISLLSATDNSLVKTEITQANGAFVFENLKEGTYLLSFDEPGYKPFLSEKIALGLNQETTVNVVIEALQANNLNEVVVQKKKPLAEYKIDRTVVNVDAMISSAGSDAMDVLEKSPGISVDQNGTITFKGKSGVVVFIDDKPTYLSGADLEAYLKSLPASTLDQIELITNPPAKYEAAGSAGIINIKTKKSKAKGFNGNLSMRGSVGKRAHSRNSLGLNYTNNKVRIFGNAGYATQEFITDLYIFRRYKNEDESTKSLFDQNTKIDRKQNTANLRLGMDYYLSDKTTLGINLTGMMRRSTVESDGSSMLRNPGYVLDSTIVANNTERNQFKNGGVNLNFSHDFDGKGKKLTADADYLVYDDNTNQVYRNSIYQPNNSLSSYDESTGKLPAQINIYTFKTDYSHPLPKESTLEAGYKISYSKTDNVADYADIIADIPIPNYDTSNHFKYDEMINAAYLNYSKSFKRFSIQAGLRLENTVSKGNQLGNIMKEASTFKKDYTNLFPTAYVMYKIDSVGNNQLVMNYGKRINRPYFQDLNPFLSPLDKFTFYAGNPYLSPSFAHNVELSYRYKSFFSTTLSFSDTKNSIDETLEINNGIYYSRPGNIGKSQAASLNIESEIPFTKWLSTNIYSEVTNLKYDSQLYTERLDISGTFFFFSANNRFKFNKGWSAEIGGRYISSVESGQVTTKPKGSINFGVQKKVLQDKGSIKFSVNDVFYTNQNDGTINNLRLTDATYENRGDTRFAALTFTYAFGKMFEAKNSDDRTGAESEQNRVKN